MIYKISGSISKSVYGSFNEDIEADSEEEAKKIAEEYVDKILFKVKEDLLTVKITRPEPSVSVSDDNFTLKRGAVYLVRRYKKYVPAVVHESYRRWYGNGDRDFQHELKYLNTEKYFIIMGRKPERLGKKLCDNVAVINKPECIDCVARFSCYTNRRHQVGT